MAEEEGLSSRRTSLVVPWEVNTGTEMLIQAWARAAVELSADANAKGDAGVGGDATGASVTHTIFSEHRGGLSDGNHMWRIWPTIDGLGVAGGDAHRSGAEYVEWGAFEEKVVLNCLAVIELTEAVQVACANVGSQVASRLPAGQAGFGCLARARVSGPRRRNS